jgi:ParB-like chromosome segregation protein Spo0J
MNTKSKTILITDLRLDGPAQLRVKLDTATVNEYAIRYAEALDEGGIEAAIKALGPIEVWALDDAMILVGGHHRVKAARQVGLEQLAARVTYGGTVVDAVKAAAKSNSQHGLPLNNRDKRNAVNRVLDVDPELSSRKVAALVGCSHQTVKNIKQEREHGISNVAAKREAAKAQADITTPEPELGTPSLGIQETASDGPEIAPSPETGQDKGQDAERSPEPARPPLTTIPGRPVDDWLEVPLSDTEQLAAVLVAALDDIEVLDLINALQRLHTTRHAERVGMVKAARKAADQQLPSVLTGQGLEVLARKTTSGTVIYETWKDGECINPKARVSSSGRCYRWVVLAKEPVTDGRAADWKRAPFGIVSGTQQADPVRWNRTETDYVTAPIKVAFTF